MEPGDTIIVINVPRANCIMIIQTQEAINGDPKFRQNITEVVDASRRPEPSRPNLIKDVAQKQLYYVLYEIIEKAYTKPHEELELQSSNSHVLELRKAQQQAQWQAQQ